MANFPYGSKFQWQHQADQIASGEITTTCNDIPMLLSWLKDMNWPGAETIAKLLPKYGERVGDELQVVFNSGDTIWIHWVLASIADSFDRKFWLQHNSVIQRIAFGKDNEGAAAVALYILAKYDIVSIEVVRTAVREAKNVPGSDPEDFIRVEAIL